MATIQDIVTIESIVERETKFTESSVSLLNLVANIVVVAAIGALTAIATVINILSLTPNRYIKEIHITGTTISLTSADNHAFLSFKPDEILLFER
jgi:hypothetical protein